MSNEPDELTRLRAENARLIALPLQKKPREAGNSVFVDDDLSVDPAQWAFLALIESMSPQDIEPAILRAAGPMHSLDVTF